MTAIATATAARVVSRSTRSISTRNYGTRFKLFTPTDGNDELRFVGTPNLHPNLGGDRPIAPLCRQVVDDVFSVEGVTSVIVRPFEVNIIRSTAYDWEDLDQYLTYLIASADPLLINTALPAPPALPRPQRIRWFDTRSHECRHYGLTVRLFTPTHNLNTERNWPPIHGCGHEQTFTSGGAALVERLSNIDGLAHINFRAFEANVCKYDHFSWSELHEQIVDALRPCFSDSLNVQVQNRNDWV
ncbi:MAG: hypothetical protein P4L53_23320 [Candidatus Obscuribacterales bacterium]|nr:hypothetical protein [Candidatus Obscuribacterales bacterium]